MKRLLWQRVSGRANPFCPPTPLFTGEVNSRVSHSLRKGPHFQYWPPSQLSQLVPRLLSSARSLLLEQSPNAVSLLNLAPCCHPVRASERSLSRLVLPSFLDDYFMILLLRPSRSASPSPSGPPFRCPLILLVVFGVVAVARMDFSRHDGIFGSFAQIELTVREE